jgi:thioredoxin reductase (NADPH)
MEGIYLAGVICGGMNTHRLFIENSREHAEKILQHIATTLHGTDRYVLHSV